MLEVAGLTREPAFRDVSFSVRQGEVVGLGGLVGSGRTEIARVLFGIDQRTRGTIRLAGRDCAFNSTSEAMQAGIAYVSEDRLGQSLVMDFPILDNASLPVISDATVAGLVRRDREIALVEPDLTRLKLRFRSLDQPVKTLSGGNQQKVVLSKWLATHPRLLILDEPTQGIDVQTKAEVHTMIAQLAEQGMAIVLISSELPELVGMCDRVVVLREGSVTAELSGADIDQSRIIRAATDVDAAAVAPAMGTPGRNQPRPAAEPKTSSGPSLARQLFARRELGLACAIAVVLLPVSILNPRIFSAANLSSLALDAGLLFIAAVAQMVVVLTRNIDLSIASVIGLTAYGSAAFMHAHANSPVLAGVFVALLLGSACGLINGAVVTIGRVPSIVVTLGTLSVFRGFNSIWAGGHQISADQVPQAWLDMTSASVAGIPAVLVIALAVMMAASFLLRSTQLGRELFAIGSNPDGAKLIGIRSRVLVMGAFVIAGALAGLDGALWASRYATIDARVATGYELTVIASVVVGGVAIRGGSGTVLGVLLGSLTLLIIRNGLTLVRVDPLWLQGVYGLVILIAIGVDALVARRSAWMGGARP